jgi:hypothetical protein
MYRTHEVRARPVVGVGLRVDDFPLHVVLGSKLPDLSFSDGTKVGVGKVVRRDGAAKVELAIGTRGGTKRGLGIATATVAIVIARDRCRQCREYLMCEGKNEPGSHDCVVG